MVKLEMLRKTGSVVFKGVVYATHEATLGDYDDFESFCERQKISIAHNELWTPLLRALFLLFLCEKPPRLKELVSFFSESIGEHLSTNPGDPT